MLLGNAYIRNHALVLRDVDGSEVSMPVGSALELLAYLEAHKHELIALDAELDAMEQESQS